MQNKDLLPLFVIVCLMNLGAIVFILGTVYKFYKLKIKEFYHKFIVLFLVIAYTTRIALLIYLLIEKGEKEYNSKDSRLSKYQRLLIYAPITFHGLTGTAYTFRWASYGVLSTATRNIKEKIVSKRLNFLAVAFGATSVITISMAILMGFFSNQIQYYFKGLLVALYFVPAGILILVVRHFLKVLKTNGHQIYLEKHTTISRYTTIISVCLMIRGSCEIFDIVIQKGSHLSDTLIMVVAIVMMLGYFTEIIPSLIITYILWRSGSERKEILEGQAKKIQETTTYQSGLKSPKVGTQDQLCLIETHPTSQEYQSTVLKLTILGIERSNEFPSRTFLLESIYETGFGSENENSDGQKLMLTTTYY